MGIIYHQALIIDGNTLILRGTYNLIKKRFDELVAERRRHGLSVKNLGLYTPYVLGFSDLEVSSMVSYAIDNQDRKYFGAIATMCINRDTSAMARYLDFVRSQGY